MNRIRVLVAKPGLDGHDRGARVIAAGTALPATVPAPKPPGIPATRLDHTAICVKDISASIKLIEEILGQSVAHTEYVDAQKVDAAFFDFPNGASLELVAPRGNAGLDKFLEKRGDALHHLALRVKDIDEVLKRLDARGVPLIDKVGRPGARGHRVAFL